MRRRFLAVYIDLSGWSLSHVAGELLCLLWCPGLLLRNQFCLELRCQLVEWGFSLRRQSALPILGLSFPRSITHEFKISAEGEAQCH